MALVKVVRKARLGIPPAFNERCVVRCIEASAAPNSKGKMMVTAKFELCGWFDDGEFKQVMVRDGIVYKLAGLRMNPKFFTLSDNNLSYFADLYELITGQELVEVDTENPDLDFLKQKTLSVIASGVSTPQRKQLTDDEKQALIDDGKPAIGEILTDDNDEPITDVQLNIRKWLKVYAHEVPSATLMDQEAEAAQEAVEAAKPNPVTA